jgi:hypothetical protein
MDIQQQIAGVEQKQRELLTQAEHARVVRQLRADRTGVLAYGYAAALKAIRRRRHEPELQEPIRIRSLKKTQVSREQDGPIAA